MRLATLILIPALVLAAACGSDKKAPPPASGSQATAPGDALPSGHPPIGQMLPGHPPMAGMPGGMPGEAPDAGGPVSGEAPEGSPIVWDVPDGWTATRPANAMRVANFPLGDAGGKVVEVVVFSLGGTPEQNVSRWLSQFTFEDAASEAGAAHVREFEVSGLRVTRLDVTGTFGGGMSEGHAGGENHRMLAVTIDGGAAPLQVKLVGPADFVAEHEKEFDAFVASIRPAE